MTDRGFSQNEQSVTELIAAIISPSEYGVLDDSAIRLLICALWTLVCRVCPKKNIQLVGKIII